MDKSCLSSGGGDSSAVSSTASGGGGGGGGGGGISSTGGSSSSNRDHDVYLKQINKMSHKISKPMRSQSPVVDPPAPPPQQQSLNLGHSSLNQAQVSQSQPQNQHHSLQQQQQQQQHQPPVYNINKSDFRDVVQRLTGSPAHERDRFANSAPPHPPVQQPKPPSSRLHRIRPPPLAQISNRPPNLLSCAPPPTGNPVGGFSSAGFLPGQRQPLSPLPPFPAVHAAAESPISAYMRCFQNSIANASAPGAADADLKRFPPPQPPPPVSPLAPRWNSLAPSQGVPRPMQQQNIPTNLSVPQPNQQLQNIPPPPPPTSSFSTLPQFPAMPSSPLPFGCLPSPGMMSPGLLFSPTGQLGFPQLPLSPTVPVPSPKWNGV